MHCHIEKCILNGRGALLSLRTERGGIVQKQYRDPQSERAGDLVFCVSTARGREAAPCIWPEFPVLRKPFPGLLPDSEIYTTDYSDNRILLQSNIVTNHLLGQFQPTTIDPILLWNVWIYGQIPYYDTYVIPNSVTISHYHCNIMKDKLVIELVRIVLKLIRDLLPRSSSRDCRSSLSLTMLIAFFPHFVPFLSSHSIFEVHLGWVPKDCEGAVLYTQNHLFCFKSGFHLMVSCKQNLKNLILEVWGRIQRGKKPLENPPENRLRISLRFPRLEKVQK